MSAPAPATLPAQGRRVLAMVNRAVAALLLILAVLLLGAGLYLGVFAWLNDGVTAAVRLVGTVAGFGLAALVGAVLFGWAARAHAAGRADRWWIQLAAIAGAYTAFGVAAFMSSVLDDLLL